MEDVKWFGSFDELHAHAKRSRAESTTEFEAKEVVDADMNAAAGEGQEVVEKPKRKPAARAKKVPKSE